MAFGETAQAELMRLRDGNSVSIQGGFKAELYRPADGGEPRENHNLRGRRSTAPIGPEAAP